MIAIHIIERGKSLCGFPASRLPEDHSWSSVREDSTCARCRDKAGLGTTIKHWLKQIDELYVVVVDNPEGEGVAAVQRDDMWLPLIAADRSRLKTIMPLVRNLIAQTGQTFRLVKFSTREVIEEIKL